MHSIIDQFHGIPYDGELSTEAKEIVDLFDDPDAPPANLMDIAKARSEHGLAAHDVSTPVDSLTVEEVLVEDIRVRVYTPKGEGPFPVFIFAHGGCWVFCSLDSHDSLCRFFSHHTDCIVLSVDYSLAPERPFPHAVNDLLSVTKWAFKNVKDLGGNSSLIAIGGDSAGGNLAAVVSQQLQGQSEYSLSLQVLMYPICEATAAETSSVSKYAKGYFFTKDVLDWTTSLYLSGNEASQALVSPQLGDVTAGLAPAFIVVAECDILQDQGLQYAGKLKNAGVRADCHFYYGMPHAFVAMAGTLELGKHALLKCSERMREAFA